MLLVVLEIIKVVFVLLVRYERKIIVSGLNVNNSCLKFFVKWYIVKIYGVFMFGFK